jgi:hypothetical protein
MDKPLWQDLAKQYWSQPVDARSDAELQTAMDNDPELKKYILNQKPVFEVLEHAIELDLQEKIKGWSKQNETEIAPTKIRKLWRTYLVRAASIAILIIGSIYFWPTNAHKFALNNYDMAPSTQERGGESTQTGFDYFKYFEDGKKLLTDKKYEDAYQKMQEIIQYEKENPSAYTQQAEWNSLLILSVQDANSQLFNDLYMKIKSNEQHSYRENIKNLK